MRIALWIAALVAAGCSGPEPGPVVEHELPEDQRSDTAALVGDLLKTARANQSADLERAWRSAEAALEIEPDHGPALDLHALLAWARSKPGRARASWGRIAEDHDHHPAMRLHRALAGACGAIPNLEPAKDIAWLEVFAERDAACAQLAGALKAWVGRDWEAMGQALGDAPDRWETWALRGLYEAGRPEGDAGAADYAFGAALKQAPVLGFICAGRARLADAGEPGAGRAWWDQAIRSENWRADHRRDRALSRLAAGDVAGAQTDLEWSLRIDPQDDRAMQALARVAIARRDFARAIAVVKDALKRAPTSVPLLVQLARLYEQSNRPAEAVKAWSAVLELDPRMVEALAGRARARKALGDDAGARADLEAGLQLNPDDPAALLARAQLREREGDARGARADCDAAIAGRPGLLEAYQLRARLRLAAGDTAGALADCNRYIEQGGVDAWVSLTRGTLRIGTDDLKGAAADLDRAVALDPDNVAALLAQGKLAEARGQLDKALAAYDAAVTKRPSHRVARARRGLMHAQLASRKAARADLEAALGDDQGDGLGDRELQVQCRMALADLRAKSSRSGKR